MASLSGKLAAFVAGTRYETLPPEVTRAAKRMMIDTLAVAWAGTESEGPAGLRRELVAAGGAKDALLWGWLERAPLLDAVFINGVAAAALDYDGLHMGAVAHTDIVCLPAVLAVAEREHKSGREFLAALVMANEMVCRLGLATHLHSGWFYTSIHGVFGAAAGCAKLLGLDANGIQNAFGVALSQVGGTQQSMVEKALTKRVQAALAGRAGAFSAQLARAGVSAPREAFEGRFGFYKMYEEGDTAPVLAGLGERYESAQTSMKKYPSCACNHAALEAALALVREYDLKPEDCEGVKTIITPYMHRLVGAPYDPGSNPQVAAQFSVQYSVACAVLRRRLGVAEIQAPAALDPALNAFARRVEVVIDQSESGELTPASVEITTRKHGVLKRKVSVLPGTPQQPLSDDELGDKVKECFAMGVAPLDAARIARLRERVAEIEQVKDMAEWTHGL